MVVKPGETESDPGEVDPQNDDPTGEEDTDEDGLDPKVKALLSKKNREAKNLRERLKETEGPLAEYEQWKQSQKTQAEKDQEEREALLFTNTTLQDQLDRQTACLQAGIPPEDVADIVDRLRGTTAEELLEDAKKLKEKFSGGSRRADPSQGRGGANPSSPADVFGALLREGKR